MDRKYIAITAALLALFIYQPAYSAISPDDSEPKFLENTAFSDSMESIESNILEYTQDTDSIDKPIETLALALNLPIPQNNDITSENYSQITNDMSIDENKKFLEEYMKKYGYSTDNIESIIDYIEESEVKGNLAPSFYTSIEKGYIYKYIEPYKLGKCFTNEAAMSNINKLIDIMKSKGYSSANIIKLISELNTYHVIGDLAPSLYTSVKKGYINEYIDPFKMSKCFTNEAAMSKMNDLIDYMISKKYSIYDIKVRVKYFNSLLTTTKWENLPVDKLLRIVEKEIPIVVKSETLYKIKFQHDHNIYHYNDKALEICVHSSLLGPVFFIVTPIVFAGFIITEALYLPMGLIGGYKDIN